MPAMSTDRIEDWLAELRHEDEARCELVQRVRRIVMQACPKATQEFKYGGILFTAASPFCGIFSYTHHVSLEFGRGAEMPDKHQVLEGEGKLRRHIKIVTGNDLFTKNVGEYVALGFAAASRLPGRTQRSARVKAPRP
jgi:hypothetical protein